MKRKRKLLVLLISCFIVSLAMGVFSSTASADKRAYKHVHATLRPAWIGIGDIEPAKIEMFGPGYYKKFVTRFQDVSWWWAQGPIVRTGTYAPAGSYRIKVSWYDTNMKGRFLREDNCYKYLSSSANEIACTFRSPL